VLDKDGTLIDFHAMWSGWAEALASRLETATGRPVRTPLFAMLGYDAVTGRAHTHGALAATPMARLRDLTLGVLVAAEVSPDDAETVVEAAWQAPDPVATAHPLADLPDLLAHLRTGGRRVVIATSDDRAPTVRTLAALGIDRLVDDVLCADDGIAGKPAPDMVLAACSRLGITPDRTAVVGDSPADVAMGRAAGAGLVIAVRTGVGTDADLTAADVVVDSVGDLIAPLA
jgi:HAD superfamily hydrolase (TIGR01509 family)